LYITAGALLLICIGIQCITPHDRYHFKLPTSLKDYFPEKIDGWVGTDQVLGDTELVRDQVKNVLQYDDILWRVYKKGATELGVYVVYWKPENQMQVEIGHHTPDICWVNAGWRILSADYNYQLSIPGISCTPAQYRYFETGGTRLHVAFWHLVGGRLSGYGLAQQTNLRARLPERFGVLWADRFGFYRSEQYFIRLSSNMPFEQLEKDKGFQTLYRSLMPMGVGEVGRNQQMARRGGE
jgi:hypothetical protein